MVVKDGDYYYRMLRKNVWGVWQHHVLINGYAYDSFIRSFETKEEARREVFLRNGWIYIN